MKRAFILGLALTLAMCSTALALDETTPTGDLDITTTVPVAYIVSIPADADITFNTVTTNIGEIELTGARLEPGHQITVTISGITTAGAGVMDHDVNAATKLAYSLEIAGVATNATSFTADGAQTVEVIIAQAAWDAAPAGGYSDTLTFTVANVEIP